MDFLYRGTAWFDILRIPYIVFLFSSLFISEVRTGTFVGFLSMKWCNLEIL